MSTLHGSTVNGGRLMAKGKKVHVMIHVELQDNKIVSKRCMYHADGHVAQSYPDPYVAKDDLFNMESSAHLAPLVGRTGGSYAR